MTDKIVDLDAQRPHVAGPVLCLRCEHEWVAVRPVGTHPMECPKCQAMMGYSWSNVRSGLSALLGEECCGPALKLATLVHRLGIIEFDDSAVHK